MVLLNASHRVALIFSSKCVAKGGIGSAEHFEQRGEIVIGAKVKMKRAKVGEVKEIRGKRAVVQIGLLPMSVELSDPCFGGRKRENCSVKYCIRLFPNLLVHRIKMAYILIMPGEYLY